MISIHRCLEKARAKIQAVRLYCEQRNGQSDATKSEDSNKQFGINVGAGEARKSFSNDNHLALQR